VIALGVVEYIKNPRNFILKMLDLTRDKIIINFAVRYSLLMPLRKIWLSMKKCPVYFVNKKEIYNFFKDMDSKIDNIILIGRHPLGDNYIVTASSRRSRL
jgi:hypothetical protein